MQTPVRFYITEGDDRPVVRTIPVPVRVADTKQATDVSTPISATERDDQPRVRVARLVRSAVRRHPTNQTS